MMPADYLALISPRWKEGGELQVAGERHEEYADLRALLLDASAAEDPDVIALAEAVARACMGDDHLWHDLGLPSRTVLSELLHAHFPRVAARNVSRMRWKKFFYRELCAQVGIRACRAPSCGVCAHYADCFGSEELPLRQLAI
ncbi:nitrogen fixation protein NifQ [Azoarcus sp. DN11]|uniref:nitrogen fixation protein NifQ n=1 Tax=Azoarcus sp. DN11 TaxID=356837 RepID=UPI000EB00177|nr:nitrogen fixation protein NifQ [Azoarcus sp. DN11]AYH43407.1 nitrogen fixation protein NifQ [Azoarcus sp. DN11]